MKQNVKTECVGVCVPLMMGLDEPPPHLSVIQSVLGFSSAWDCFAELVSKIKKLLDITVTETEKMPKTKTGTETGKYVTTETKLKLTHLQGQLK